MLTSKEVLDHTGISRATLNNYISSGLVTRPEVLPPGPDHGDAPRIGYFPDDVLARIAEIQRLKNEGWSLARIAERFSGGAKSAAHAPLASPAHTTQPAPAVLHADAQARTPVAPSAASTHTSNGAPGLTDVAVLVANLDNPHRLWAALPPGEYFELINQIWFAVDPIVRGHQGVHGKHSSDGMVCYFLPRTSGSYVWSALAAAIDMREAMASVSREWQVRKGWPIEVRLNTGVDEGQEWLGNLRSATRPEFAGLAGTLRRAARVAECADPGAVWATKNLVLRLSRQEQEQLSYGIRHRGSEGDESVIASLFALADSVARAPSEVPEALALVPITEVIDIAPGSAGR